MGMEGTSLRGYRHARVMPKDNLYALVRRTLGLSQREAARQYGISHKAWIYRERSKVMYWPLEIHALQQLSGASNDEMIKMIKACM